MSKELPDKEAVLSAIRKQAETLGRAPTRAEFTKVSATLSYHATRLFGNWSDTIRAAGLQPDTSRMAIPPNMLLEDWANVARFTGRIPTLVQYRLKGKNSPEVLERRFGPWAKIPGEFRKFAESRPEWADVVTLIPLPVATGTIPVSDVPMPAPKTKPRGAKHRHPKLNGRATHGDPIDFRALRYEPANEAGVVFLFGMVAGELGYLVEALQEGYPDCEAKRQVGPGAWQPVRIEFEFESRTFRDHGHSPDGCDVIVCWQDNWPDRPAKPEVLELSTVIKTLASQ